MTILPGWFHGHNLSDSNFTLKIQAASSTRGRRWQVQRLMVPVYRACALSKVHVQQLGRKVSSPGQEKGPHRRWLMAKFPPVFFGAAMLYVYVWDSLLHYESQTGLPLRWRFCLCCHWERIEIKLLADVRYMDVAFLVRGARPESKLFGRPSDPLNLWWFACSPPQALWTWNLWNLWFLRSLFPQAMHPV